MSVLIAQNLYVSGASRSSFVANMLNQKHPPFLLRPYTTQDRAERLRQSNFDTRCMDFILHYPLATTLPSWNMASLPPSSVDVNTETIVVASCLGGGLLLATAFIVTIMIVKRRARLRKLQEKDIKMEATKAWARQV